MGTEEATEIQVSTHANEGYRVIEGGSGVFRVFENATGTTMPGSFSSLEAARKEAREYNRGRAFNGWTPEFVLAA